MMRDGTIASDTYPEYYDKIEKACNGAVRLVEDFLEYKKLQIGGVTLKKTRVNLNRLVVDIARTYDSKARAQDKRITIHGGSSMTLRDARPIHVLADPTYLQRAVENLVTNAIKFAGTTVDMTCTETQDGITLMVRDDGPGVSEDEKEDIFKIFHTSAGNRTAKGIGVGLASVRTIVQAHGGKISVERGEKGGCAFKIALPPEPICMDSRTDERYASQMTGPAHVQVS
jgi:signal transduction histidine kinase